MADDFPSDVKAFINQHIHSIAQLEVLLMLRLEPNRRWQVDEITARLYLQKQMVAELLADLERRGFVVQERDEFRYQPANETLAESISSLAKLYHERRVAVTTEIFAKPIDPIKAFADAFRLRGKE